ncbi:MAG: type II toxin-antitoxin system HicB family antitoxin [Oligoflexia bacterium]|nr:type II toxin-antitoxin system HicB family antitoxin [Oligoflexia bacterium]
MKLKNYIDRYAYQIEYSEEDKIYISRCAELPDLLAHGKTDIDALKEIKVVVGETLKWMEEEGEDFPEPLSHHKYSGELRIRMSQEKHRQVALKAKLQGVSMNQYILSRI